MHDLVYALRSLRRAPLFTSVAVLSLALAIGAIGAIFSLIDAALLKPLPGISDPSRLASIYHVDSRNPELLSACSWADYVYYRDHTRSFSGLLAYVRIPLPVQTGNRRDNVSGELVSSNYFQVLGVAAQLGRIFTATDDNTPVVVLSDRLWRERFAGSPGVVGQTLVVGGTHFSIVGVAPPRFRGIVLDWGESPQLWVSMRWYREASPPLRRVPFLERWEMAAPLVTGRLREGADAMAARSEIATLSRQASIDHPERAAAWQKAGREWLVRLMPLNEARFWPGFRGEIVKVVTVLSAVAGGVLLIACMNIASLLSTRTAQRRRELAVRVAVGARSGQIVRLLLTEALVIAAVGGAAGVLAAYTCVRILASFPRLFPIPLNLDLVMDLRVLAVTAVVTGVSALLVGVLPAIGARKLGPDSELRSARAPGLSRAGWSGLRASLLAAEVALTVMLLAGAGLFLRTYRQAASADPFLRAGALLIVGIDAVNQEVAPAHPVAYFSEVLERVRQTPGVQSAALASNLPLGGMRSVRTVQVLDPAGSAGPQKGNIDTNTVSGGYFALAGSRIIQGRDFDERDREDAPAVAIVNEQLAARYWNGDAQGRHVKAGDRDITVIGVVRDSSRRRFRAPVGPVLYLPASQEEHAGLTLLAATHGNPLASASVIRAAIGDAGPAGTVQSVETLGAYSDRVLGQERLAAWCLGYLSLLALVLSTVGLYGSISYRVSQRTAEIGVRMALGAGTGRIVRMVVGEVFLIAAAGGIGGLVGSVLLIRYIQSLLFGVEGSDPITWAAVTLLLAGAALLAAALPASRAASVDPAVATRCD